MKLSTWHITVLVSLFIAVLGNITFWKHVVALAPIIEEPWIAPSLFVILVALINALLTLVSFKPVFKWSVALMLLASASAAYFMDNYGVMIDKGMIRNVFATDFQEGYELISVQWLVAMLLLAGLPIYFVFKAHVQYQPFFKGLLHKAVVVVLSFAVMIGALYVSYQPLSFFAREHRSLRHYINPVNYIMSSKMLAENYLADRNIKVTVIGADAKTVQPDSHNNKPSLVILVLGETARAMNFSLNGYAKKTNPLMQQEAIVNYSDVTSCGTATAESVPCMFSMFGREDYSHSKGRRHENLLDVAVHAGYHVQWLNNNTGCQGVCERVSYVNLADADNPKYCADGNCYDEILLEGLQQRIDAGAATATATQRGDQLIVLHINGNHGPTYDKRYPDKFRKFTPVCATNQLTKCTQEEIVSAYDNAILYTDYLLAKTLEVLKANASKYNTSMLYVSDHGESLGENNIYLHGLPYAFAPDQQKKVPMMLWLSEAYKQSYGVDEGCLKQHATAAYSHDHLFSSMLGLLGVDAKVYNAELDILAACRN